MKEPTRLTQGRGAARELMQGSGLRVPGGARQRALQFTGVAVGVTASGTAAAAAGASTIAKSLVLTVSLGALGGGLVSLGVSQAYSHFVGPQAAPSAVTSASPERAKAAPIVVPVAPVAPSADAASEPAAPAPELPAPDGHGALSTPSKLKPNAPLEAPPSPSVGGFSDEPQRTSLVDEQRIIESVRAAVAQGDVHGALAKLDDYDRRYSRKQFGPEALALRVQAVAAAGEFYLARSLAKDFEQRYPHHPLLPRVKSAVTR